MRTTRQMCACFFLVPVLVRFLCATSFYYLPSSVPWWYAFSPREKRSVSARFRSGRFRSGVPIPRDAFISGCGKWSGKFVAPRRGEKIVWTLAFGFLRPLRPFYVAKGLTEKRCEREEDAFRSWENAYKYMLIRSIWKGIFETWNSNCYSSFWQIIQTKFFNFSTVLIHFKRWNLLLRVWRLSYVD